MKATSTRASKGEQYEDQDWPCNHWTPKQRENFENHRGVYDRLETDRARSWFKRCYRPKKRNDGLMRRDHVKLGTPEDYILENVSDRLEPMSNLTSVMMRQLGHVGVDKDVLDEIVEEFLNARVKNMKEHNPQQLERILRRSQELRNLYGIDVEET